MANPDPVTERRQMRVKDRELERQGRALGRPAGRFLLIGLLLAIPGIVLIVIDATWSIAFGIALVLLGSIPAAVGLGLIVSSAISRWSARHKSFA